MIVCYLIQENVIVKISQANVIFLSEMRHEDDY